MTSIIRYATIAALLTAVQLTATARTAADFFVDAPPKVEALFDRTTRLDMLDYFNNGMKNTSNNALQGRSRVVVNTPDILKVKISDSGILEFDVIPLKNDTIIAVIETVGIPMADSGIRFYHSDWTPAPQPAMPSFNDFIPAADRKKVAGLEKPSVIFTYAEYLPERKAFRFLNTTESYYTPADTPEALKFMLPEIFMRFDGKKLVPVK